MTLKKDAPTAPEQDNPLQLLHAILQITQDILDNTPEVDIAHLQQQMTQRGVLLDRLNGFQVSALPVAQQPEASQCIQQLQALEPALERYLYARRDAQKTLLGHMGKASHILKSYKVPAINTSSGIENCG